MFRSFTLEADSILSAPNQGHDLPLPKEILQGQIYPLLCGTLNTSKVAAVFTQSSKESTVSHCKFGYQEANSICRSFPSLPASSWHTAVPAMCNRQCTGQGRGPGMPAPSVRHCPHHCFTPLPCSTACSHSHPHLSHSHPHLWHDGSAELAHKGKLVLLCVSLHDGTMGPHLCHDAACDL